MLSLPNLGFYHGNNVDGLQASKGYHRRDSR